MKGIVKKVFNKLGFEISRIKPKTKQTGEVANTN